MAMTVHVDVVSTEESIFSGLCEFVALPGETGELGILPGHTSASDPDPSRCGAAETAEPAAG